MFGIKKKGAEIKQPVYVVLVPEVAAYASAASFPVDSVGKLVFLNDTVDRTLFLPEQIEKFCPRLYLRTSYLWTPS